MQCLPWKSQSSLRTTRESDCLQLIQFDEFPPFFNSWKRESESVETDFLRGLRYVNMSLTHSLTHSGEDTVHN